MKDKGMTQFELLCFIVAIAMVVIAYLGCNFSIRHESVVRTVSYIEAHHNVNEKLSDSKNEGIIGVQEITIKSNGSFVLSISDQSICKSIFTELRPKGEISGVCLKQGKDSELTFKPTKVSNVNTLPLK